MGVPTRNTAKYETGSLPVASGDVANPVFRTVHKRFFTAAAFFPKIIGLRHSLNCFRIFEFVQNHPSEYVSVMAPGLQCPRRGHSPGVNKMKSAKKPFLKSFAVAFAISTMWAGCSDNNSTTNNTPPAPQPGTAPVIVTIAAGSVGKGPQAFGTNPLVINQNQQVIWVNDDTVEHTATADDGSWDTGTIAPSATSSPIPFPSPGTFPYHCAIHGAASMSGTIEVSPSPSPSASPSESASPSPSPSSSASASPSPSPSPSMTMYISP